MKQSAAARVRKPRPSARRRPRRPHGASAGMTLVEIMIVVAIMAMIAGAVAMGFSQLAKARVKQTQQAVRTIAAAVVLFRNDSPDQCPDVQALVTARQLDRNTKTNDEWGHAFVVTCSGEDVKVVSAGPDGQMGSADDISSDRAPGATTP